MTCTVTTCDRPARLAGLCGAHHQRLLRHGDVRADVPLRGQQGPQGQLWCSSCRTWKPTDTFYRNATTKSGRDGICTACTLARRTAAKTHRAAVAKTWRDANRDQLNKRKRAAYHRNPVASTEAGRAWRLANPERVKLQIRAQNAARYARQKNAPGKATATQIAARWTYYGNRCWMCKAPATDTDHVKPLAAGGSNWPANLRPSCSRCNRAKSATWPLEAVA